MRALTRYILIRIGLIVPTLLIVSSITFILLHMAPGNPIDIMLGAAKASREVRDILIQRFGFDEPLHIQYFLWVYNMFRGELGLSISGAPVIELIGVRLWYTVELMLVSQGISALIAVILGALAGYRKETMLDKALSVVALVGYSLPNFWLSIIVILVFSLYLGWFPVGAFSLGIELARERGLYAILIHLRHLALPTAVLVVGFTPYYFRLLRATMVEVVDEDYITMARAKGLKEVTVIYKHALKNAVIPLLTAVGTSLGLILGGSYVVELVFAWPGLGHLLVTAAIARDYWLVMGISFITAVMVIVSSIALDMAYAYFNPKIRFAGSGY